MKKLTHVVLALIVLGALFWTLQRGFQHHPDHEEEAEKTETAESGAEHQTEHEDSVVTLTKEKWEALGIVSAEPAKAEAPAVRMAFGRVLDPTPLVTLDSDLASAEASLAASHAEYERTQKLLAAGENTSRKAAESAEAQFRADEIKAAGLRRQALLQWGEAATTESSAARREFAEALVRGDAALVRVDLLPGDALSDLPHAARLVIVGREQQSVTATHITPAADADPRTQAQGFILRVEKPVFALRPGMALTAWLELDDKPREGFLVPRSAILRHDGATWFFAQEEEGKFERKAITLDLPMKEGWFVEAENGGVAASDKIVTTGAQALLSEEMKASSGGSEAE